MQNIVFSEIFRNVGIRIKNGTEEAAVGTAKFFVEVAEQPERKDRFVLGLGCRFGLVEIRVPEEMRGVCIPLHRDGINSVSNTRPILVRVAGFGEMVDLGRIFVEKSV